jgi:putative membrane protein
MLMQSIVNGGETMMRHAVGDWVWWMAFGRILMIVFWGLIILGVYMLISRRPGRRAERPEPRETALEILERRYASGELPQDQFDEMRQRLASSSSNPSGS